MFMTALLLLYAGCNVLQHNCCRKFTQIMLRVVEPKRFLYEREIGKINCSNNDNCNEDHQKRLKARST